MRENILKLSIVLASVVLYFLAVSLLIATPLNVVLSQVVSSFYTPEKNLIFVKEIAGINTNITILFLIALSSICLLILRPASRVTATLFASIVIFILVCGVQTYNFATYFTVQYGSLRGKTIEEKQTLIFGDLYQYAQFAKHVCPPESQGYLLMDDINSTTGMHDHIVLAYYLFPLRIQLNPFQALYNEQTIEPHAGQGECLLYFRSTLSSKPLPQGYQVRGLFNHNSAIAVKEGY